ncbi:MAG TPA: hypothetical protein VEH29_04110 [Acidimicrobiales bacterium]|nr:hypothetical protein [Acidimicrobiales bacterium]
MAVFLLVPVLVLLGVILLAPLMLPGAVIAFVVLAVAAVIQRHHAHRAVPSH